jgi:daunorubicin resistance ABC transporter membrane protein
MSKRSSGGAIQQDLGIIRALWKRDMWRLFRERSRWLGVVIQPLIFWFILGSGIGDSMSFAGGESDYFVFFYPGILAMIVLFTTIFATISVIEDRQSGFLQSVMVAPGSRMSMVLGKVAGVTTVALIQSVLFLLFAPLAGFSFSVIAWPQLVLSIVLFSICFTSIGFTLAWLINSTMGYHGIMSVVLIPLWILSGAMFPMTEGWIAWAAKLNPISYGVSGIRGAMQGGAESVQIWGDLGILAGCAVVALILANRVSRRRGY